MDIERRLYYYGLGAGVPYGALNSIANAVDKVRFAPDISKRRRIGEQILKNSLWRGFIPKNRGYVLIEAQRGRQGQEKQSLHSM